MAFSISSLLFPNDFSDCLYWNWVRYFTTFQSSQMWLFRRGVFIFSPSSVVHLLSATYSCPKVNVPFPMSIITLSKVFPWLLWIVTAQASFIGYWVKEPIVSFSIAPFCWLNLYLYISHVCGDTLTLFPLCVFVIIRCLFILIIFPMVPFTHLLKWSFATNIIWAPFFSFKKSSVGKEVASNSPHMVPLKSYCFSFIWPSFF